MEIKLEYPLQAVNLKKYLESKEGSRTEVTPEIIETTKDLKNIKDEKELVAAVLKRMAELTCRLGLKDSVEKAKASRDPRKFQRTATQILNSGERTGCCDSSTLLVSMLRSLEVPCAQILTFEKDVPQSGSGHMYTAVYVDADWWLIDSDYYDKTKTCKMKRLAQNTIYIDKNYAMWACVNDYSEIELNGKKIHSISSMIGIQNKKVAKILEQLNSNKKVSTFWTNREKKYNLDHSTFLKQFEEINECPKELKLKLKDLGIVNVKQVLNSRSEKMLVYCCKIPKGFYYLLGIPARIKDNKKLVVESYNSHGKKESSYKENVIQAFKSKTAIELSLFERVKDSAIVLPIIPAIEKRLYAQQLSIESVKYANVHEDFKKCIDDAKLKVHLITGKKVADKIILNGYSSSGIFAQRFALIYPELIDKCLVGGAAGTIPVPNDTLEYPLGVKNYNRLFDKDFDYPSYKQIKFGYYVAENEEKENSYFDANGEYCNVAKSIPTPLYDMSYNPIITPVNTGKQQRQLYGETMNERYKRITALYRKEGIDLSNIIVKGANHEGIWDPKSSKSSIALIEQMDRFIQFGKDFKFSAEYCAENLK